MKFNEPEELKEPEMQYSDCDMVEPEEEEKPNFDFNYAVSELESQEN